MKFARSMILAASAATVSASSAVEAQIRPRNVSFQAPSRFTVGGDLLMSQPRGEFAEHTDNGFGGTLYGMFRVDRDGALNIRLDLGGLQYGSETVRVPFFPGTGRVGFEVVTSNNIGWAAIGPQFMFPIGPIRPYANVGFGVMHFSTTSAVRGTDDYDEFARTTNQSDDTETWVAGGGVYIRLGQPAGSPLSLNLGGRYFTGGEATYLTEGAIRDNPDGSISVLPTRSRVEQATWHVGLAYTIPRRGR